MFASQWSTGAATSAEPTNPTLICKWLVNEFHHVREDFNLRIYSLTFTIISNRLTPLMKAEPEPLRPRKLAKVFFTIK